MIDFNSRLKNLKDRRQGTRERALVENNLSIFDTRDYRDVEKYEAISESAGVKYAIGAMAPVDPKSTKVSIEEGERVANTLISSLRTSGINATKRLQGSVALDIHIKGHSDVDMLVILADTILMQMPKLDGGTCYATDRRPMVDIVAELRLESEDKLTSRYHEVAVNCKGNKSIAMEGGSLKRKIDIVPSCWYNTHDYQRSGQEYDRGVHIYHKGNHELLGNLPFKHIKRVDDRDVIYSGNVRRVARLLKNMIADMPEYKKTVAKKLTSYDIAAIAYNMDERLSVPDYMSLGLVEVTREFLHSLLQSKWDRDQLTVPDGSRRVFDSEDKLRALEIAHSDINDLAKAIFSELEPCQTYYDASALRNKAIFL